MILALVKVMITAGHNPAEKLWVQAIDVDRMAALMCYIQLSLWNVPAEVIVGNTEPDRVYRRAKSLEDKP